MEGFPSEVEPVRLGLDREIAQTEAHPRGPREDRIAAHRNSDSTALVLSPAANRPEPLPPPRPDLEYAGPDVAGGEGHRLLPRGALRVHVDPVHLVNGFYPSAHVVGRW